jgi:hypothetical protein
MDSSAVLLRAYRIKITQKKQSTREREKKKKEKSHARNTCQWEVYFLFLSFFFY